MLLEFSDEKVVATIQIPLKITESDIENIIVDSFEGGSNYWMGVVTTTLGWEDRPKGENGVPISQWATKLILEGKQVQLFDIEDEEDTIHNEEYRLTLNKLLEGIKLNAIERPFDSDLENMDATTVDCIIQYALFNKVVFG